MVNVADVDCSQDSKVCKHFKKTTGTYYFADVTKDNADHEIESFDAKSVLLKILGFLPDVHVLKEDEFKVCPFTSVFYYLWHAIPKTGYIGPTPHPRIYTRACLPT